MTTIADGHTTSEAGATETDGAKRRQILAGARRVFLAKGYEGASMDGIAKAAGVSKGTLYVYFDSKEALFEALILGERAQLAEALFDLPPPTEDFRAQLEGLALNYVTVLSRPDHIASIRMVIGAVDQFPGFGAIFFKAGPELGRRKTAAFFDLAVAAGYMRPCDTLVAAGHFMDLCAAGHLKRLMFGVDAELNVEFARSAIRDGVDVFLRAYGA